MDDKPLKTMMERIRPYSIKRDGAVVRQSMKTQRPSLNKNVHAVNVASPT